MKELYHPLLYAILLVIIVGSCGCDAFSKFSEKADEKFGDQHFKTAISLIELHKTRFDEYPNTLGDLKYIGDWDRMIFSSVKYSKLVDGYELILSKGWVGKAELKYPADFWHGLGIKKTNVKGLPILQKTN